MVAILIFLLTAAGEPFIWEIPDEVQYGETFSLTITCSEPGCTGISTDNFDFSRGLQFRGSSTSTSISTVSTPSGRHLSQILMYQMRFTAGDTGIQSIGPITVNLGGVGSFIIDEITVSVSGAGSSSSSGSGTGSESEENTSDDLVWLQGELRDPGGRIYPGTRLTIDYYVYARVGVENVTYWWTAPELGVIRHVETIPDSNWEGLGKRDNSSRSRLAVVEMTPAAAGSLQAPVFSADITGTGYDVWGKTYAWSIETDPLILPVYPFPENPPANWDGTLLDSVSVLIEQLPAPPGQGGELSFRVTCMGPGQLYMEEPPDLALCGNSRIFPSDSGQASNKRWWDYILEPEETGCHILGPDTLVWLDRRNGEYRLDIVEPCSLQVAVIPRTDRVIELQNAEEGISSQTWILIVGGCVVLLTVILGTAARRKDKRLTSITSAEDLDELLTGLENELSVMLSGRKEYMGFEELDEFLNMCDTDTLLSRRILRFWKDLEGSISEKDITKAAFEKLKRNAEELLEELKQDLSSGREYERDEK